MVHFFELKGVVLAKGYKFFLRKKEEHNDSWLLGEEEGKFSS